MEWIKLKIKAVVSMILFLRWAFVALAFLWMLPVKTQEKFYSAVDSRVWAIIAPMKEARDIEMKEIRDDISQFREEQKEHRKETRRIYRFLIENKGH